MIWAVISLSFFLLITLYYCIKFALIIIRVKDAIEDSFEKIDDSYYKISEILQIPLFYDSKEVKNTLGEIKNVRDILLFIASQLSNSIEEVEDE